MFIIAKGVAEGIRALGKREDVQRELDAIRAMPGYEVYANAIAEGVGESAAGPRATPQAKPADPPK